MKPGIRFANGLLITASCLLTSACGNGGSPSVPDPVTETGSWQRTGGPPGLVTALLVTRSGSLLAGTNGLGHAWGRGLYRSTPGAGWKGVGPEFPVVGLAMNGSGHVFAAGLGGTLWRSMDDGASWTVVASNAPSMPGWSPHGGAPPFLIDDDGDIFVGSLGVHRSSDNGATWSAAGLAGTVITTLAANRSGDLFAGTFQGVHRSSDNGESWSSIGASLGPYPVRVLATGDGGRIFAGVSEKGVFRSDDNGATWVPSLSGYANSLVVSNNGDVFAGTLQGLYRSTDGGLNWAQVNGDATDGFVASLATGAAGEVFSGTGGGVFRSTNNGDDWTPVNDGLDNGNIWHLERGSNGHLFAGTSFGGVFRSTDGGSNWEPMNSGLAGSQISDLAIGGTGTLFAVRPWPGVYRSTDNGTSWQLAFQAVNSIPRSLAAAGNRVYLGMIGGGLFRSSDDGVTWETAPSGLIAHDVEAIAINDLGHVFAGTNAGVFRSTDHGDSWEAASSGLAYLGVQALAVNGSGALFVLTNSLYRSLDGGVSWTEVYPGLGVLSHVVVGGTGTRVYVAGEYSADNGDTWVSMTTPGLSPILTYATTAHGDLLAGTSHSGVVRWIAD